MSLKNVPEHMSLSLALGANFIWTISWAGKTLSDSLLPCLTGMGRAGTGRALHPAQEVTVCRTLMAQLPVQGMTQLATESAELPLAAQGMAVRCACLIEALQHVLFLRILVDAIDQLPAKIGMALLLHVFI